MKYIYLCLTSEGQEIKIKAEEYLFIEEIIEEAGRDDLMILEVKTIDE